MNRFHISQKIIFFIILTTCSSVLFSQNNPAPRGKNELGSKENYSSEVTITDVHGRPFKNNYPDVKGSPFFLDKWSYSVVKLENGIKYDSIEVRLDLSQQELHYMNANNVEMIFFERYVKEIEFFDSSQGKNYKFQTGFPAIDNQDQNNFYQVLSEGSVSFLKSIRKNISVNKNDISGEVEKQFDVYEDYYVFFNNQMKRLKKEKEFILKILLERKDAVETFLKTNTINFRNMNDLIKLFNFYNSLTP